MSLFIKIRDLLTEPRLAEVDPDSDEMLVVHSKILYENQ